MDSEILNDSTLNTLNNGDSLDSTSMRLHLFKIWSERLHDDMIFTAHEEGGIDMKTCMVSEDNIIDILETLDVEDDVTEDEILNMLNEDLKDQKQIEYVLFKEKLFDLLVFKKKVSFSKLVH